MKLWIMDGQSNVESQGSSVFDLLEDVDVHEVTEALGKSCDSWVNVVVAPGFSVKPLRNLAMLAHCGEGIPTLVKLLECAMLSKKSMGASRNLSGTSPAVIGEFVVKSLKECALRNVIGPFVSSRLSK